MSKLKDKLYAGGQVVEIIRDCIYGKKGERGIIDDTEPKSLYGTKLKMLSEDGRFTGEEQTVYSASIDTLLMPVEEEVELKEIPETTATEVSYITEDELEARILEIPLLDIERVKKLSQIELKTLVSMYSGFHPKYIDILDIETFTDEIETDVYVIDFEVIVAPHLICSLTHEEGVFDLFIEVNQQ